MAIAATTATPSIKLTRSRMSLLPLQLIRLCPLQALHNRAAHHPVLVALTEEAQLFRKMADALAIACLGVRIREIGPPIAALRAVGVEHAFQVYRNVAERIGLARNAG